MKMVNDQSTDAFVDKTLGFGSSHPFWLSQRWSWLWWLASLPLMLTLVLYLIFLFAAGRWIDWLQQIPILLKLLLTLGTFCIAFGLTFSLNSALALRRSKTEAGRHVSFNLIDRKNIIYFAIGFLLACIAPGVVAASPGLPFFTRVLTYLFASLPLIAVVVLAFPTRGTPQSLPSLWIGRLASIIEISLSLCFLALALTLINDFAALVNNRKITEFFSDVFPQYQELKILFLGLITLTPVCYLLSILRRRLQMSSIFENEHADWSNSVSPPPNTATGASEGIITKLFRYLFGRGTGSTAPQLSQQQRVDLVLENLNQTGLTKTRFSTKTAAFGVQNTFLLKGKRPTTGQLKAIESFQMLFSEANEARNTGATDRNCDLLIHGPKYSGKTATLIACVIDSVVRRGQHVIVLSCDQKNCRRLKTSIDERFAHLQLSQFVGVELLSENLVHEWKTSSTYYVPQVVIATVDQIQHLLFGTDSQRISEILSLFHSMFVDDFNDFDEIERSHLPFLIDKQRWIVEDDFSVFQAVVSCSQLSDSGVRVVSGRLATSSIEISRQCIELFELPLYSIMIYESPSMVKSDVTKIGELCHRHGLEFLDFYDHDFLSKLKNLTSLESDNPIVVLANGDLTVAATKKIRAVGMPDHSVIICRRLLPELKSTPVSAGRDSSAFRTIHFENLSRFLTVLSPIHTDVVRRFGISIDSDGIRHTNDSSIHRPSLFWDPQKRGARDESIGFASLHDLPGRSLAVSCQSLPNPAFRLWFDRPKNQLFVSQDQTAASNQASIDSRTAIWKNNAGQELRLPNSIPMRIDLAHERNFRLALSVHDYVVPTDIRKSESGGYEIYCQPSSRDRMLDERVIPQYQIKWDRVGSGDLNLTNVQSNDAITGGDIPFYFAELKMEDRPTAKFELTTLYAMNESRTQLSGVSFEFEINLSVLILKPSFNRRDDGLIIKQLLSKSWATRSNEFLSSVSLGFATTANRFLPGMLTFGLPLAFKMPEIGGLIVWLIQPTTGSWTASEAVSELFRETVDRRSFFREYIGRLLAAENELDPIGHLRNAAMLGFETVDNPSPSELGDALAELRISR